MTYTGLITTRYHLDFGPEFDRGVISNYPPSIAGRPAYPIFVSKVDEDGNEVAGVRLTPVAAPIATTTGWGCDVMGSARTKAAKRTANTFRLRRPRRSGWHRAIPVSRWRSDIRTMRAMCEAVEKACNQLEKQRFLLPSDVQKYIEEAESSDVLRS